ncbi:MAG TPA: prepilin-type N-terminal cleavage/methylation domain-containing protein [Planctomycetota bacterium]|nr:prepilin-type N-terminal cleavage/methylation domain-containing protein [Planctomycetota bacterium]
MRTRSTRITRATRRGLTLVEILIAMAILLIGATMLLIALTAGLNMQQEAMDDDQTVQAVGDVMGMVDQLAAEGRLPPSTWEYPQDFKNNPRYAWRVNAEALPDIEPQPTHNSGELIYWPFLVEVQIIRKNRGDPIPVTYHTVVLVTAKTRPLAK